uniref:Nitrite reductase n=1 Tax=Macrostomum lignano TaxID=282301 RepID=A0A1I8HGZ5_9PLAT
LQPEGRHLLRPRFVPLRRPGQLRPGAPVHRWHRLPPAGQIRPLPLRSGDLLRQGRYGRQAQGLLRGQAGREASSDQIPTGGYCLQVRQDGHRRGLPAHPRARLSPRQRPPLRRPTCRRAADRRPRERSRRRRGRVPAPPGRRHRRQRPRDRNRR